MEKEFNLLMLARRGDNLAKNNIIKKYENIIVSSAKKYSGMYYTFDELKQEGRLGVLKAIEKYDFAKNVNFVNFASVCVKTSILTLLRKMNKKEVFFSTITDDIQFEDCGVSIEETLLAKDMSKKISEFKKKCLNTEEKKILNFFLIGLPYKGISLKLKISEKKVDNSLYKIKNKLKNFILK